MELSYREILDGARTLIGTTGIDVANGYHRQMVKRVTAIVSAIANERSLILDPDIPKGTVISGDLVFDQKMLFQVDSWIDNMLMEAALSNGVFGLLEEDDAILFIELCGKFELMTKEQYLEYVKQKYSSTDLVGPILGKFIELLKNGVYIIDALKTIAQENSVEVKRRDIDGEVEKFVVGFKALIGVTIESTAVQ